MKKEINTKENQTERERADVLTDFDIILKSKKQGATLLRLVIVFCAIVVTVCVVAMVYTNQTAMNKIIVVDSGGVYPKIDVRDLDQLQTTLVLNTCKQLVEAANSFDRSSILTNQGKAFYYCSKSELLPIFEKYKQEKSYLSAQERGVIYSCDLENVSYIQAGANPFDVHFTAVLTVIDGNRVSKFRITATGKLKDVTPEFPKNVTGYFFTSYNQTITNYGENAEN
jgi:hypothetical protein